MTAKSLAVPLVVSSIFLFYAGLAFAYYVVFPLVFGFFTSISPDGVEVMTDINAYLSFVMRLFFVFGLAFEIPVAIFLLIRMAWSNQTLSRQAAVRIFVVFRARHAGHAARCHQPDHFGAADVSIVRGGSVIGLLDAQEERRA